ncbi:MAG: hypothetical protein HEQ38_10960 [Gemmatimonas sp.]|nr:hypothetical protein [Gemmatimonas sp.]
MSDPLFSGTLSLAAHLRIDTTARAGLVRAQVVAELDQLKAYDVPSVCVEVGIQSSVSTDDGAEAFKGKARYVCCRIQEMADDQVIEIARRLHARNASFLMAEALQRASEKEPLLSEVTRREVVSVLEHEFGTESLGGQLGLLEFLKRVWPIDLLPSFDRRHEALWGEIWRHTVDNPEDWSLKDLLLERLGILSSSTALLLSFLGELFHPVVRSGAAAENLLSAINRLIEVDGWRLTAQGDVSGRPVYRGERVGQPNNRIKNLIFAAGERKPDIVISNALTNEIAVVRNEEYCLIYDRDILADGLRWTTLVEWYSSINADSKIASESSDAERALFRRLQDQLHPAIERAFFRSYFAIFRSKLSHRLPALVPQVYLHYDPKTIRQRVREATRVERGPGAVGAIPLPRQRMDFLMLLPNNSRIVFELDGKHHYADGDRADPSRYATMVAADRELRLAGYEVYRFGGAELSQESLHSVVSDFFSRLFDKHGV